MLLRLERHELGLRVHIWRWRCHHYHVGEALIAVGALLIWKDRADLWH
jgi:hypothetical protein